MFILALFSVAKMYTFQNLSLAEWIDKLWYVHSMDNSIAVKMNELSVCPSAWKDLWNIVVSNTDKWQNKTYNMIPTYV